MAAVLLHKAIYAHFMPYKDRLEIDIRKDEFDFYKAI